MAKGKSEKSTFNSSCHLGRRAGRGFEFTTLAPLGEGEEKSLLLRFDFCILPFDFLMRPCSSVPLRLMSAPRNRLDTASLRHVIAEVDSDLVAFFQTGNNSDRGTFIHTNHH